MGFKSTRPTDTDGTAIRKEPEHFALALGTETELVYFFAAAAWTRAPVSRAY
jgi:hypothetical protein